MSIQMCPSKMIRLRHAAAFAFRAGRSGGGEDGGRGGRIGKVPGCRKMVFHRFQARVDGKTHTAHGPFLFKSGKR